MHERLPLATGDMHLMVTYLWFKLLGMHRVRTLKKCRRNNAKNPRHLRALHFMDSFV